MTVSTVWSVSCLLFFYSRCPLCPAICKSGEGGHVTPCPMNEVGATANEYSFNHIKFAHRRMFDVYHLRYEHASFLAELRKLCQYMQTALLSVSARLIRRTAVAGCERKVSLPSRLSPICRSVTRECRRSRLSFSRSSYRRRFGGHVRTCAHRCSSRIDERVIVHHFTRFIRCPCCSTSYATINKVNEL